MFYLGDTDIPHISLVDDCYYRWQWYRRLDGKIGLRFMLGLETIHFYGGLLAAHLAGAGMSDAFGMVYEVANGPLLKKELEYGRTDGRLIQPDHACQCGRMIPYNHTQCSVCLDEEIRGLL